MLTLVLLLLRHYSSVGSRQTCHGKFLELLDEFPSLGLTPSFEHLLIHLDQILLLGSENGAWTRNADPTGESRRREAKVLHAVERNERAGTPKACLAVDSNRAFLFLCSL